MNMKLSNLSLIAAVLLACCATVTAQGANTNAPAGGKHAQLKNRLQTIAAELSLTDDQKQQLKPILKDEAQKLKTLRADTSLDRAQKRAQRKAIRQDFVAKVKPILTPEQIEKWQSLRAAMRAKRLSNN
jgi:Spy/CpxP family protein refolding chaperone